MRMFVSPGVTTGLLEFHSTTGRDEVFALVTDAGETAKIGTRNRVQWRYAIEQKRSDYKVRRYCDVDKRKQARHWRA